MSLKRIVKSLNALFSSMAFLFAGSALIISSAAIILKNSGISEIAIGFISSCFFIGGLISTISAHKIISKVGHIRSFGIFSAIFAISAMMHMLSDNVYFWAFLRFMIGICYYGLLMVIESWLNEKAKNEIRSRVLSFYEIVFYISFGIGVLIIALNLKEHTIFIISSSLIMFSSLPLNFVKIKEPSLPKATKISIPKIFDIVPLALVTSLIAGMLINGFSSMGAVFIILQNIDPNYASYFIFCAIAGGFISQFFVGKISDKLGRKFAIIMCASIGFLVMLTFLLFDLNFYLQCILALFLGCGIFCLYVLSLARANDMLDDKTKSVEVGRGILFCYSFGSLLSPILLGILMQKIGYSGFIWFYMVCLLFLILFSINKPNILKKKKLRKNPGNMVILDND